MKNLNETLNEVQKCIHKLIDAGFIYEELYIHVPIWFKDYLINEVSKEVFIARIEPFKFNDVEIVAGYENIIVISNSKKFKSPEKLKFYKVKIS